MALGPLGQTLNVSVHSVKRVSLLYVHWQIAKTLEIPDQMRKISKSLWLKVNMEQRGKLLWLVFLHLFSHITQSQNSCVLILMVPEVLEKMSKILEPLG